MLLRHFNLREQPFGVTPDPRFLFGTATHREALAALLYGVESGLGFMSLIASPGMGKTTILFEALARLGKKVRTVFIFQAIQTPIDLFRALLIDLGEKNPQGSLVDLETRLNEILTEQSKSGASLVVVLDEAQNLDFSVLEAVRMLSNFETPSRKLLQIVLCGQLQLADRLAEPDLLQLSQRISIFACLTSLTPAETDSYIQHRLKVAGYEGSKPLFNADAVNLIANHSGGIPRNINNLCFNALSLGCAMKKNVIDAATIREVIGDLKVQRTARPEQITIGETEVRLGRPDLGERMSQNWASLRVAVIAVLLLAVAVVAGRLVLANSTTLHIGKAHTDSPAPAPTPAVAATDPAPPATAAVQQPATGPTQSSDQARATDQAQSTDQAPAPTQVQSVNADAPPSPQPPKASRKHHRRSAAGHHTDSTVGASSEVHLVAARAGQSLNSMCTEQFGECGAALLNRIQKLNPHIADPNHLEQGKKVIMPVAVNTPQNGSYTSAGG